MNNQELVRKITDKLAEVEGINETSAEQLVKSMSMITGSMMLEAGICLVETDELELAVNAK